MVKFISISLNLGLIISVLCIIISSVNCNPLFLKTIARASSSSSGFNSLNSYSGYSNQNSHNGNSAAVNSNPIQGLINTKINIVGRALIQIGTAFERYGHTENSGSSPQAIQNGNGGSITKRITSTTKAPETTFDIDTGGDDDDIKNIESDIKPNGLEIITDISVADDDDKVSTNFEDEKESEPDAVEKDSKDEGDEKDLKDDSDSNTDTDEALKIDLFKLDDEASGNGFSLEGSSEMKKVPTENDINNEGSASSTNEQLENLSTIKGSATNTELSQNSEKHNQIVNTGDIIGKVDLRNLPAGYNNDGSRAQSTGYNYNAIQPASPREYKYNAPNPQSSGYQYSRPNTILPGPGYTYQSIPNTQSGYNYQPINFSPPGYNYQQRSNLNIIPNGYKYEQPIVTTTTSNGVNYVQAGSQSSGNKIKRIRSTTSGYHYPKPEISIGGSFIEGNLAQPSPYFNNGQSLLSNNYNYKPPVTLLNNAVPKTIFNSQILNSALDETVFNSQSSGLVIPSQFVNNLNLNNGFNYQPESNIYTAGPTTVKAASNFNTNFGTISTFKSNDNVLTNLKTTSTIPSTFENNFSLNSANFNTRPTATTSSNSANIVPLINNNQQTNSLLQSQQLVQYSQSSNGNANQINLVAGTNRPSFVGNSNQSPGLLQNKQSNGFLINPIQTSTTNVNRNNAISSTNRPFYAGNVGQNLGQNQQFRSPNSASVNQNQRLGNSILDNFGIIPSIVLNLNRPSSTTSSFAGNNNQRQNLLQTQRSSTSTSTSTNLPVVNQKITKPEIDHFAIIPSLVRPSNNRNKNANFQTGQEQNQQRSSFSTTPNFNLNLSSALKNSGISNNNNNQNQRLNQPQAFRINTASNSFNQNQNSVQQNNQNINRNPTNGFSSSGGGVQNQGQGDSTIRLSGNGYNIGSQIQRNQNQQGSTTNDKDDVSESSLNTLSALKNLTESEYYENGVKKLQYPTDDDEVIAFRSESDSSLVGDIRRYRKAINPIQYN